MGSVFKPKAPTPPTVAAPTVTSPTTSEVSQSEATNADGATNLKVKRKGRSATILTSPTGVEGNTTLGMKSLLGG